uniref:Transmembrane protein n=1 Tax=Trieres chinensis TaxID=1514140 RepID=A0A7S2AAP4_TRICV|mmetsp:Transcript_9510/g.20120  ORF Transcript_9510/g.20120 Transcript_9510/m.20120 type:complete len:133 (+) Transcript_9510:149-547(+)|eukprot:CAMPEP_0183308078 /NCGR_PEP_ID=MMETSP0160_2-20130417/19726_1 /TAXON_ID=2839 ORGANISM="Odontella Sinensis, Strain Grunow 1884" /NCGR_SAMPLE_ID=MMETSP0160_2 /ASSEMBLY_ACC=CAM_ASM_000250 /LENGTH=132 /DNA_ID=CAMNT_0025471827 /DNA_START=149 /DNA_END=547 /DNA_ORIENTATION=-
MTRILASFAAVLLLVPTLAAAFVVTGRRSTTSVLKMAVDMPPAAPAVTSTFATSAPTSSSVYINDGVSRFLSADESSLQSSSTAVSLEERRPPTKEEIEAKKKNFAFWFWGGGFVAPFLATFYYFGFKFWER